MSRRHIANELKLISDQSLMYHNKVVSNVCNGHSGFEQAQQQFECCLAHAELGTCRTLSA